MNIWCYNIKVKKMCIEQTSKRLLLIRELCCYNFCCNRYVTRLATKGLKAPCMNNHKIDKNINNDKTIVVNDVTLYYWTPLTYAQSLEPLSPFPARKVKTTNKKPKALDLRRTHHKISGVDGSHFNRLSGFKLQLPTVWLFIIL